MQWRSLGRRSDPFPSLGAPSGVFWALPFFVGEACVSVVHASLASALRSVGDVGARAEFNSVVPLHPSSTERLPLGGVPVDGPATPQRGPQRARRQLAPRKRGGGEVADPSGVTVVTPADERKEAHHPPAPPQRRATRAPGRPIY